MHQRKMKTLRPIRCALFWIFLVCPTFIAFAKPPPRTIAPEPDEGEATPPPPPEATQNTPTMEQPAEMTPAAAMPAATTPTAAAQREEPAATGTNKVLRDPFWPVGFIPRVSAPAQAGHHYSNTNSMAPVVVVNEPPKWDEATKLLSVQGIMKTGSRGYVAVVNGQVVSAGDVVHAVCSGRKYSWTIGSVNEKGVKFNHLDVE
jgi:hypothetical protein